MTDFLTYFPTYFPTYSFPASGQSTNRNTPARLSDVANLLDYGGDNTNTNDNSVALYNAMASGKGKIIAPAGTYKFTKGPNLDNLGSNLVFNLEGAGSGPGGTIFNANGDFFIIDKVLRNPGSVFNRSVRGIRFTNSKTTPGSAVTTINGYTYNASGSGQFAGQHTLTVALSAPHGYTVGTSRLLNIAGLNPTGANGLRGCLIDGASSFTFQIDSDPGPYVGGNSYAPIGGACSVIGYFGGGWYDCGFQGYYGLNGAQDTTFLNLYNCHFVQAGNVGVGLVTSGNHGIFGGDATGWATAIQASPIAGCSSLFLGGFRAEINTVALDLQAASCVDVVGGALEGNIYSIITHGGQLTFSGLTIHGEAGGAAGSAVNGIKVNGNLTGILLNNIVFSGDFSDSNLKFDSGTLSGSLGIRLEGVSFSNSHGAPGTGLVSYPVSTIAPQTKNCVNFYPSSTYANRPADAYCMEGDTWLFTNVNNTVTTTGTTLTGANTGTDSVRAVARYSSNSGVWSVIAFAP